MPAGDDELREFVRGLKGGFQPSFMDRIRE